MAPWSSRGAASYIPLEQAFGPIACGKIDILKLILLIMDLLSIFSNDKRNPDNKFL